MTLGGCARLQVPGVPAAGQAGRGCGSGAPLPGHQARAAGQCCRIAGARCEACTCLARHAWVDSLPGPALLSTKYGLCALVKMSKPSLVRDNHFPDTVCMAGHTQPGAARHRYLHARACTPEGWQRVLCSHGR